MRSAIKLAYSMGSVAVILSGAALSAPPAPFGAYTGGGGTIAATCPAGTGNTCSTAPITGLGFMQREETIAGQKYIHTIIDDGKGFKSEDFVQFNNTGTASAKGIASRSSITETASGTKFDTSADILTGWAVTDKANNISEAKLGFGLDVAATTGKNDGFNTKFTAEVVTLVTPPAGSTTANKVNSLAIDQIVGLDVIGDKQHFYTAIKPAATSLAGFKFVGGQGLVTYTAPEPIQLVWIGQQVTGAGAFGTMTLAQAKPDGSGTATTLTDTTATGPNFPTQVTTEFFSATSPAPTF